VQEFKRLDEVISNTVKAVEQGREQINSIADDARLQREELKNQDRAAQRTSPGRHHRS